MTLQGREIKGDVLQGEKTSVRILDGEKGEDEELRKLGMGLGSGWIIIVTPFIN